MASGCGAGRSPRATSHEPVKAAAQRGHQPRCRGRPGLRPAHRPGAPPRSRPRRVARGRSGSRPPGCAARTVRRKRRAGWAGWCRQRPARRPIQTCGATPASCTANLPFTPPPTSLRSPPIRQRLRLVRANLPVNRRPATTDSGGLLRGVTRTRCGDPASRGTSEHAFMLSMLRKTSTLRKFAPRLTSRGGRRDPPRFAQCTARYPVCTRSVWSQEVMFGR
jgi:hypothetical protein